MKETINQKQNESNADLAKRIVESHNVKRKALKKKSDAVPNHITLRVSDEIMDMLESEQLRIEKETGILPSRSAVVNLLLRKQLGI